MRSDTSGLLGTMSVTHETEYRAAYNEKRRMFPIDRPVDLDFFNVVSASFDAAHPSSALTLRASPTCRYDPSA